MNTINHIVYKRNILERRNKGRGQNAALEVQTRKRGTRRQRAAKEWLSERPDLAKRLQSEAAALKKAHTPEVALQVHRRRSEEQRLAEELAKHLSPSRGRPSQCTGARVPPGVIFFEAPLHLAISNGGLGGGQIRRVETGHNRMRVLS